MSWTLPHQSEWIFRKVISMQFFRGHILIPWGIVGVKYTLFWFYSKLLSWRKPALYNSFCNASFWGYVTASLHVDEAKEKASKGTLWTTLPRSGLLRCLVLQQQHTSLTIKISCQLDLRILIFVLKWNGNQSFKIPLQLTLFLHPVSTKTRF